MCERRLTSNESSTTSSTTTRNSMPFMWLTAAHGTTDGLQTPTSQRTWPWPTRSSRITPEDELWSKCLELYEEYTPIQQGGPLMAFLLLQHIQDSSEQGLELLRNQVKALNISKLPGEDIEQAVSLVKSTYHVLQSSSTQTWSYLPTDFAKTVFRIFQTSTVFEFNEVFHTQALDIQTQADLYGTQPHWPSVMAIVKLAMNTYQWLKQSGIWDGAVKRPPGAFTNKSNPSRALTMTPVGPPHGSSTSAPPPSPQRTPKCWNCGGDHLLDKCTRPWDQNQIDQARQRYFAWRRTRGPPHHKTGADGKPLILNKNGFYVLDQRWWHETHPTTTSTEASPSGTSPPSPSQSGPSAHVAARAAAVRTALCRTTPAGSWLLGLCELYLYLFMSFAQHSAPWFHILPWLSIHMQLHMHFYLYIPTYYYYAFCLLLCGMGGGADVDLLLFAMLWFGLRVLLAHLTFYLWLTLLSHLLYLHPTLYHQDICFWFIFYAYVDSYLMFRATPSANVVHVSADTDIITWHYEVCEELQFDMLWHTDIHEKLGINLRQNPLSGTIPNSMTWMNLKTTLTLKLMSGMILKSVIDTSEDHLVTSHKDEQIEWTPAKVRQAHVATIGLLEKLGLKRNPTGCGTASYIAQEIKPSAVPIVIDTGCSISVTPFIEDFVTELQPAQEDAMQGLNDSVQVKGIGWVDWTICDIFNWVALVRTQAYHVPEARVRLLSTQTYFQEHGKGLILQDHKKVILSTTWGEELSFPYDLGSNLPLMYLDHRSATVGLSQWQVLTLTRSEELDHTCMLLDYNNYNLSKPQKELMLWHQCLGHAGFRWIQTLMRKPKNEVGDNTEPPVLPTKNTSTSRCDPPRCCWNMLPMLKHGRLTHQPSLRVTRISLHIIVSQQMSFSPF